jgi:hypothetical protein
MRIFTATTVLAVMASSALGQTQPTQPSSQAIVPTLPTDPTRPNYPCYATAYEPCSSVNRPIGSSVNTPPAPQFYVHSFTADQARTRIEASGYSSVAELQKDVRGNWHGTAVKDGKTVQVTLDFDGNVSN